MKKLVLIIYACVAALACAGMVVSTATGYRFLNPGNSVSKGRSAGPHGPGSHGVIFHK